MLRRLHENTLILLVDAQSSFVARMHGAQEPILARIEALLRFAEMLSLPVVATLERPVAVKGPLHERVAAALPPGSTAFEKSTFDALGEIPIRNSLASWQRPQVAVAGAETDVCVLQTVLSLLAAGYQVTLLTDCVFSSEPAPGAALRRMETAGATPDTFKSFAYGLTRTVDRSSWPPDWRARLAAKPELFADPEDLPPL